MASELKQLTIEEVNSMDFQEFVEYFAPVIGTPVAAACVWVHRPFQDVNFLHRVFCAFIHAQTPAMKEGILRCYPDLAGKLAQQNTLPPESTKEQKSAGLLDLSEQEQKELSVLNKSYKCWFSHPFVICARENKKETIFREIKARLNNTSQVEVEVCIGEVCKIAWHRLLDIVADNMKSKL